MEETRQQTALIEDRKHIAVTGVDSVDAFSEREIALTLTGGGRAVVSGSELKIVNFSKTAGSFSASGKVTGLRFLGGKEKMVRRLLR